MPRDPDRIPRAALLPQRIQEAKKLQPRKWHTHSTTMHQVNTLLLVQMQTWISLSPRKLWQPVLLPSIFQKSPTLVLRFVLALEGLQLSFAFTDFQAPSVWTTSSKQDAKLPFASSTWRKKTTLRWSWNGFGAISANMCTWECPVAQPAEHEKYPCQEDHIL